MSRHLRHTASLALALALVQEILPCIPEGQRRELVQRFYDRIMGAADRLEERLRREYQRLVRPSRN